jgi:hypothetical protein
MTRVLGVTLPLTLSIEQHRLGPFRRIEASYAALKAGK